MNVYITYERTFFTEKQIKELEQYGKLIFLESYFDLDKAQYLQDNTEKILMADPEWYKWNLRKEHISKIKNLKAICINTTAFDWIDWQYCKDNGIIVTHEHVIIKHYLNKDKRKRRLNNENESNKHSIRTKQSDGYGGITGLYQSWA